MLTVAMDVCALVNLVFMSFFKIIAKHLFRFGYRFGIKNFSIFADRMLVAMVDA